MHSLKDKILLYILLPVALVVIGFVYFNFSIQTVISEHFQGHADEAAEKMSFMAKDAILLGDRQRLTQIIFDEKYLSKGISYLAVYDKDGKVLADTNLGKNATDPIFFQPVDTSHVAVYGKDGKSVYAEKQDNLTSVSTTTAMDSKIEFVRQKTFVDDDAGQRYYLTDIPVHAGLYDIGLIRIVFNFSELTEELNRMGKMLFIFGAVFFVMLIYLAGHLSKSVIAPVKELTRVAQQYANGDFNSFAQVSSLDEIGDLAVTFNMMKSNLELSRKKLVEEKKAVETKAAELEAWQKTAVARELKMVELKNKIKYLENKNDYNTKA
ncbi:cell wall metabolism sensor histidine kinase WalK [Candidatus Falkowbacteria bacterium]|nr:cell wall metabolism sensor histidine kinase WalK [Candidatus Falkowbacteria bacterium]